MIRRLLVILALISTATALLFMQIGGFTFSVFGMELPVVTSLLAFAALALAITLGLSSMFNMC